MKSRNGPSKTYLMYTAFNAKSKKTGGTRRFQELLEGLLENNEVHLICPSDANFKPHQNLKIYTLQIRKSRVLPQGIVNFFRNINTLLKARYINYDHLIAFSLPYAIQFALLNFERIIFLPREDFVLSKELSLQDSKQPGWLIRFKRFCFLTLEKIVVLNSEIIVTQSNLDRETLILRHFRVKDKIFSKFRTLNNNVNPSWTNSISNPRASDSFNRQLPTSPGIFDLIFIGNLNNKKKGLHLLISAVQSLKNEGYQLNLDIIGEGKLLETLRAEHKQNEFIKFLGYKVNPSIDLVRSNLLVVPSFTDSFPNVILEALYHEVPVIGSRVGGIPEMLVYEELLFDPTEESLYNKIKLIIDRDLLEEYQKLCLTRKQALTFDWVDRFENIISEPIKS